MSNRLSICHHCGNEYQPKLTEWNYSEWTITTQYGAIVLRSIMQVKFFDLLWRKQGAKGLNRKRIIDILYADDIDGGPEVANITHEISRLRKLIEGVGIHLKRGSTGGDGYSLMFVTPDQAKIMNVRQAKGLGCKGVSKEKIRKTDGLEPIWMTKRKMNA